MLKLGRKTLSSFVNSLISAPPDPMVALAEIIRIEFRNRREGGGGEGTSGGGGMGEYLTDIDIRRSCVPVGYNWGFEFYFVE